MITLGFDGFLNASVSVGDNVYRVTTTTVGQNTLNSSEFTIATIPEPTNADPVLIGQIVSIQTNDVNSAYYTEDVLSVETTGWVPVTTQVNTIIQIEEAGPLLIEGITSDFLFFSKNNLVNMASLTGYYSEIQFRNNSTTEAELFATSCEIEESSK